MVPIFFRFLISYLDTNFTEIFLHYYDRKNKYINNCLKLTKVLIIPCFFSSKHLESSMLKFMFLCSHYKWWITKCHLLYLLFFLVQKRKGQYNCCTDGDTLWSTLLLIILNDEIKESTFLNFYKEKKIHYFFYFFHLYEIIKKSIIYNCITYL